MYKYSYFNSNILHNVQDHHKGLISFPLNFELDTKLIISWYQSSVNSNDKFYLNVKTTSEKWRVHLKIRKKEVSLMFFKYFMQ